jgi:undecaprenyl-diphosphatase
VYGPIETAAATIVAFVVAILVIAFFMNYISKRSFLPFVIYRIGLGAFIFTMLGTGAISA